MRSEVLEPRELTCESAEKLLSTGTNFQFSESEDYQVNTTKVSEETGKQPIIKGKASKIKLNQFLNLVHFKMDGLQIPELPSQL